MKIKIFTTGGTIDKVYFDQKSTYQVGAPNIALILKELNVNLDYSIESVFRKDSLDITTADRKRLFTKVQKDIHRHIIITHGTDTMVETGKMLMAIPSKVIVLTGALQPALFKDSDAMFNIGCAVAAVQTLPEGTYITMNGCIFAPDTVRKNLKTGQFERQGKRI